MKRKLFFFIERLQVSRQEIRAVSICLIVLILGFGFVPAIQVVSTNRMADYREQDRIFLERTATARHRHREWVERLSMVDTLTQNRPTAGEEPEKKRTKTSDRDGESSVPGRDEDESEDRLDLNQATEEELQLLPGIGPTYAERMVQWREQFGPYLSVEQLIEIRGIGPKRLETLRSRVRVSAVHSDSL
ncbi:MAG: ComEA family DNA-binding protein [Bacteroidota bacterium]